MSSWNVRTWRKLIACELSAWPEETLIACTLTEVELDEEFDAGHGTPNGKPFTAWTQNRVLFPLAYDGMESVGSAPRNPCDEKTKHM